MKNQRILLLTACVFACLALATPARTPLAQTSLVKNPSPELVGQLTKGLSITPQQATGGAGSLFGLAKSRLKPAEFGQISKVVPGMDGLLKSAPKSKSGAAGVLGSVGSALPGQAGGLASVAGAFKSLGLSPEMASKFVPIMTKFVEGKGGANLGSLLGGVLK
jgi:hypothetical protein